MTEELGGASAKERTVGSKSKKVLIAILIVSMIILASGLFIWYKYYRNWSIEDVSNLLIDDPTEMSLGFKHSLAGKTLTVEGKITNITTWETNLGIVYFVELDEFHGLSLVSWDELQSEIGDRIESSVSFEWSQYNDERHVYSPQLSWPGLAAAAGAEVISKAISETKGIELVPSELPNGSIKITVEYAEEPVPISIANCSFKNGRASASTDASDFYGNYMNNNISDRIENLSAGVGVNGTLRFYDNNSDGYLDIGDYFTFGNLGKPDTESGIRTYLLLVEWKQSQYLPESHSYSDDNGWVNCYIIMKREGLLTTVNPPFPMGQVTTSAETNGVKFEIQYVHSSGYPSWDNAEILLQDSFNFARWNVSSAALNSSHSAETTLPTVQLGTLSVSCKVTDQQGNGRIDALDSWSFTAEDPTSFSNSTVYRGVLMDKPSRAAVCSGDFMYGVAPLSNMTVSELQDGKKFTFGTIHTGFNQTFLHMDTTWDEIVLELIDGNGTASWSPDMNSLRQGSTCTLSFTPKVLSNITVYCNVTDLNGDGYVNIGDQFTLRTNGPDGFLESESYTLRVGYDPVPGDVFVWSFTG